MKQRTMRTVCTHEAIKEMPLRPRKLAFLPAYCSCTLENCHEDNVWIHLVIESMIVTRTWDKHECGVGGQNGNGDLRKTIEIDPSRRKMY